MDKDKDYEQLYYDSQYEIRKLKEKICFLEEQINEFNLSRTKRNINLQKYIFLELNRYKSREERKNEK